MGGSSWHHACNLEEGPRGEGLSQDMGRPSGVLNALKVGTAARKKCAPASMFRRRGRSLARLAQSREPGIIGSVLWLFPMLDLLTPYVNPPRGSICWRK